MGGHIAQELTLHHPDRVRSLGLHHTWTKQCDFITAFQTARRRMAAAGDMQSLAEYSVLGLHAHAYYDEHGTDIEAKKRWIIENSGPAAGWHGQLDACIVADTSDRLSAIRVPTIVTASDLDLLAHPHHAHEIHERIAGSEIVILKGNGHVSLIEDPDTFAAICLSFLRKHTPELDPK
jgi:pimeloyl-ACP methyl ester carboxylesterase